MSDLTEDDVDGIRIVRVEGPESNLLNPAVMRGLTAALVEADASSTVSAILLTGSGDAFCGGLDLASIRAGGDPVEFASCLVEVLDTIPRLRTPIAAAVNGDAVASGASLVAVCDYAVAIDSARIGSYEVAVGVWPMVAQVPLIHRLGARIAMENIGSGEPFSAARAWEVGLINRIVPADGLLDAARAWLRLATRAGAAGSGRASVYELEQLPYSDALASALHRFAAQFETRS